MDLVDGLRKRRASNRVLLPSGHSGGRQTTSRVATARPEFSRRLTLPTGPGDRCWWVVAEDDSETLPAAWLIEQTGFLRDFAFGAAGISSRHALTWSCAEDATPDQCSGSPALMVVP